MPLAQAIVERGHDVLWAVPTDGVDHVQRAGIRAAATGTAGLTQPAEVRRRYPELNSLPPAEAPDAMFGKLFGAISAPDRLPDLVAVTLGWHPDLVVADAGEFAGHIVAAEIGRARSSGLPPSCLLPSTRSSITSLLVDLDRSRGTLVAFLG